MNLRRIDLHRMPVHAIHHHSDALHRLKENIRVSHVRHIFYQHRLIRHH